MEWSDITSLSGLTALAQEASWRLRPRPSSSESVPLSWQVPACMEKAVLFWPRTYQWQFARYWMDSLLTGLALAARVQVVDDVPQPYPGCVMVRVALGAAAYDVAIDYSDQMLVQEEAAKKSLVYFKMQFSAAGYEHKNVMPGGFVPYSGKLYSFLPHVRAIADSQSSRFSVYGRFGQNFATTIRRRATELLRQQQRFPYEGGLKKLRYSKSLEEIARARVCVDLPGNGDFCFRLVDYLAVGSCIVGPRHRTRLHVPLRDRETFVYCADDLSDLVELCDQYSADEAASKRVARAARDFFDKYLHRRQLASYYLHTIGTAIS